MANSHLQFFVAIKLVEMQWNNFDDNAKLKFFDEAVSRFGLDVIKETVCFLILEGKTNDVIAYLAERSA